MAEPANSADRARMMQYLVPALAVSALVLLVGLVLLTSGTGERTMSDGSNGSVRDSDLKDATSGVKYRDVKEGVGEPCPVGATVTIHYTGWLDNGTVFDSSKDRGAPATFELPKLIPGWQEGIPGMKPGGVRKLVIAPEKGYGQAQQGKIPPSSTLVFEVELISVVPVKNVTTGPGKPLSDGSNGGTDDPALKDLGDGLKYRDVKEGTGEPVGPGARVTVHYTGWTVDGSVFDSSKTRGEPMTSPLTSLVGGWQKGIPGMKPGGVRKLVIPAALGYGARGSGDKIPPNATLIFEIELIK